MREFKFRVWDNHLKKFHTNISLGNGFWASNGSAVFCNECYPGDYSEYDGSFDGNFLFQQYTGLMDKNGNEIYEGDILEWREMKTFRRGVNFLDGAFWATDIPLYEVSKLAIVIGNICECKKALKWE